jgi:hypothetical protein
MNVETIKVHSGGCGEESESLQLYEGGRRPMKFLPFLRVITDGLLFKTFFEDLVKL